MEYESEIYKTCFDLCLDRHLLTTRKVFNELSEEELQHIMRESEKLFNGVKEKAGKDLYDWVKQALEYKNELPCTNNKEWK